MGRAGERGRAWEIARDRERTREARVLVLGAAPVRGLVGVGGGVG